MMTKKDYELIAKAFKGRADNYKALYRLGEWDKRELIEALIILRDTANYLAYDLEKQNPLFDFSRFMEVCDLQVEQARLAD